MLDPTIVQVILGGVLGLTVLGVTEVIKKFLKVSGIWGYIISLLVSAAATAYYLVSNHLFTVVLMIGYTLYVWATANGIFKATHAPTTPSA
jgi:uncharacterized membrane protein HdeD (DUF308 family)